MNSKFFKALLIIAMIFVTLASVIYFTRTIIDIGCAERPPKDGTTVVRPNFVGINCWFWERTYQLQSNIN